jgi:putative membrane protein
MKRAAALLWLLGMALVVGLVAYQGAGEVWTALKGAGWGLVGVCAFYPIALVVDTECWRLLLPATSRLPFFALVLPRWICDAVNGLLPSVQIGGDVVRARLITLRGVPGIDAGASVVTDITAGVVTEILFTLLGIGLLVRHDGRARTGLVALIGVLVSVVLVLAFYRAQRSGLFRRTARLFERLVRVGDWEPVVGRAEELDAAVIATYRRRREFLAASFWRMVGWFAGALEVWLALFFLGHPVGVAEALMLESLGQAIRHAAFVIPGALGVQEGGFLLLGAAAGLGPETGLALSLMKRIRELLLGLPALLVWQVIEGRQFFRRRKEAT